MDGWMDEWIDRCLRTAEGCTTPDHAENGDIQAKLRTHSVVSGVTDIIPITSVGRIIGE
jgi:hypothetical protein